MKGERRKEKETERQRGQRVNAESHGKKTIASQCAHMDDMTVF